MSLIQISAAAPRDPDIFGEQLDEPGYEDVERIAAVGAVIERLPADGG